MITLEQADLIQEMLNHSLSRVTIMRIYETGGSFPSTNSAVRKAAQSLGLPLPPILASKR